MTEALSQARRRIWAGYSKADDRFHAGIGNRPVDGEPARLKQAVNISDRLIEEAIAHDPRLAKRAQWIRRDEGEHVDTALLAQGDDQPFYKRKRQTVCDETKAGEAVRIVISTDDNQVPKDTAAAFIATVRIVQQFVPVEVWWQGAWLTNDYPLKGFVFHVPLVKEDMDFSRLDFCIADGWRDNLSWQVMAAQAVNTCRESWNDCGERASVSYLPEMPPSARYSHFVSHSGIRPEGASIASHAAEWIGLEPLYDVRYHERQAQASALQRLPEPEKPFIDPRTEAQKRRDQRESEEHYQRAEKRRQQEAQERLNQARL